MATEKVIFESSETPDFSGMLFFVYRGMRIMREPLAEGGQYHFEQADSYIGPTERFDTLDQITQVADAVISVIQGYWAAFKLSKDIDRALAKLPKPATPIFAEGI